MSHYFPIFLKNKANTVLIIGGGGIALSKAEALSSVGVCFDVVSPQVKEDLVHLCTASGGQVFHESYVSACLKGRQIAIAATNDAVLNQSIAKDCRLHKVWVNVVDDPQLCDFIFPALLRRGDLQVAISTQGIAPALARWVKRVIEQALPQSLERLLSVLSAKKTQICSHLPDLQARRLFYDQCMRSPLMDDLCQEDLSKVNACFDAALNDRESSKQAALYLIGCGPGDPELLTLKAIRLLAQADVVLYDRLIPQGIIEQYARKDAKKIFVGKARHHHHEKQSGINDLIREHLQARLIVVRLKGGDPSIFAQVTDEIEVARQCNVPYQLVPGITAATGCAAACGVPLSERNKALSVRYLTLHNKNVQYACFWESFSYVEQETLVFYMSGSWYAIVCQRLLEKGHPASTPVLVIEQGTTCAQRSYLSNLGAFEKDAHGIAFVSPSLMIVGDVARWSQGHECVKNWQMNEAYFPPISAKPSK